MTELTEPVNPLLQTAIAKRTTPRDVSPFMGPDLHGFTANMAAGLWSGHYMPFAQKKNYQELTQFGPDPYPVSEWEYNQLPGRRKPSDYTVEDSLMAIMRTTGRAYLGLVGNAPDVGLWPEEVRRPYIIDKNFGNPMDYIVGTKYSAFAKEFMTVRSQQDLAAVQALIDLRLKDRKAMQANMGVSAVGWMAEWFTDPLNYIAIGLAKRSLAIAGKGSKPRLTEEQLAKYPYKTNTKFKLPEHTRVYANNLALTSAVQEAYLHTQDPTSTVAERAMVVGGQWLAGALIGRPLSSRNTASRGVTSALRRQEQVMDDIQNGRDPTPDKHGLLGPEGGTWEELHRLTGRIEAFREGRRTAPRTAIDDPVIPRPGETRGVGAAAASDDPVAFEGGTKIESAGGLEQTRITPLMRVLNSTYDEIGRVGLNLFTPPYLTRENKALVANPTSVQYMIRQWDGPLAESLQWTDNFYIQFITGQAPKLDDTVRNALKIGVIAAKQRLKKLQTVNGTAKPKHVSYEEFQGRIFHVLNGGDDASPLVKEAANKWKTLLFEPMGKAGIDVGLFTKLRGDYAPRIWNQLAIKENMAVFKDVLRSWIVSKGERLTDDQITQQVDMVVEAVLRDRPFAPITSFETGVASGVHRRVLDIPNNWKSPGGAGLADFIYTDIGTVGKIYTRTMSADIELARAFAPRISRQTKTGEIVESLDGRNGVRMETALNDTQAAVFEKIVSKAPSSKRDALEELFKKYQAQKKAIEDKAKKSIADNPNAHMAQISELTDISMASLRNKLLDDVKRVHSKSRTALGKGFNDMEDLIALRDLLRGTFGQPEDPTRVFSRVLHSGKIWTAATLLGGPIMSAVPDIAMPILHEGMRNVFNVGLSMLNTKARKSIWKASRKDSQLMGEVFEMALASRALAVSGATDVAGRFTKFERGLDKMSSFVFVANLFNPWNDFMKTTSGLFIWSRILDDATKFSAGGKITQKNMERLARGGIDKNALKIIGEQAGKYGHKHGNVRVGNVAAWDQTPEVREATNQLRQAVASDIRRTIITPDKSDLPLWMSTEVGSVLGSLKTFSFAAMQKIMIPTLQAKDREVMMGIAMLIGIGAVVEIAKRKQRGADTDMELSEMIYSGIERGGVLSWFMDANRMIEIFTDHRVGLGPMLNIEGGRYDPSWEQKIKTGGGAVVTSAMNVQNLISAVMSRDATATDWQRVTPMGYTVPFQEMFRQIREHETAPTPTTAYD